MINDKWLFRPLGELFEIGAGKTMSAAARNGDDKTPFLRTSNVLWDDIDLTTVDAMAIPAHELSNKLLRSGDLLVCEGGEIGRAAIWPGDMEVMSFQNHLHRLRPLEQNVDPHFYVYFLQSAFTQLGVFEGAGNKTTIPNLSRSRLAALEVPQPGIGEQRAITKVLRWVRAAVKQHDRSVRLTQDLKRTAMRALFSRGLRGGDSGEAEIRTVPKSWQIVPLGALARIGNGTTPNRTNSAYWDGGTIPWITSGRMYERKIRGSPVCITPVALSENHLALLERGTILIAIVGEGKTLGHCALLEVEATVSRHVGFIQPTDDRVVPEFLIGYLESQYDQLRLLASGNGSTRGALTCAMLRGVQVPLPQADEQREIVAILNAIDRKIDLHRHMRAVLDDLFKALLYGLMTGKIRVTDFDLSALNVSDAPRPAT
jgi:type I restriction enzyme S subunit